MVRYYMEEMQRKEYSKYRFKRAEECLRSAKLLYEAEDFNGSVNRAYYSIFHAIRSVLALEGVDFSKHSGVISHFRKEYVKTGKFPLEASNIVGDAFMIREDGDYEDLVDINDEQAYKQIENTEKFLQWVKTFLQ